MNQVKAYFGQWLHRPFSADMDITGWFFFVGLLLCLAILWTQILRYIVEDI